jgi:DnaJ-domain-containing protein 1
MDEGLDPAGVAVFFGVILAIIAWACGRPEQWGLRRLALGGSACACSTAAIMLSPSPWWWGGLLWGLHQVYLGWSYVVRRKRTTHERIEYLDSSASILAYVALTDGEIDPREKSVIRDTYARAGFGPDDLRDVERTIEQCETRFRTDGSDPERLFVRLQQACAILLRHSNEQTRLSFVRAAITLATSDGFIRSAENRALQAMAGWLLISESDYDHMWRSVLGQDDTTGSEQDSAQRERGGRSVVPPDLATYYASILGVPVAASPNEVKRAYREKAKQYHPDVVAHQGTIVSREAEERFKQLSEAYRFFRRTSAASSVS